MTNCPNCGAPIEPYKHRCSYCGTYYFDFTSLDLEGNKPCYVKFKTPDGILTALAIPEIHSISVVPDFVEYEDCAFIRRTIRSTNCEIEMIFHTIQDQNNVYVIDTNV